MANCKAAQKRKFVAVEGLRARTKDMLVLWLCLNIVHLFSKSNGFEGPHNNQSLCFWWCFCVQRSFVQMNRFNLLKSAPEHCGCFLQYVSIGARTQSILQFDKRNISDNHVKSLCNSVAPDLYKTLWITNTLRESKRESEQKKLYFKNIYLAEQT